MDKRHHQSTSQRRKNGGMVEPIAARPSKEIQETVGVPYDLHGMEHLERAKQKNFRKCHNIAVASADTYQGGDQVKAHGMWGRRVFFC
jgi:hypothetical protein